GRLGRRQAARWSLRGARAVARNSEFAEARSWTLGLSISADEPGVLCFTSEHENGRGRADIYRIEYRMGTSTADK
ncbi:MAG: hypothetical protein ACREXP_15735, partial [Steroidobacteraceae bacterium]